MRMFLRNFLQKHYLSRWIVLLMDLGIIALTYILTCLIYYTVIHSPFRYADVFRQLLLGIPVVALAAYIYRPYSGILRHSTFQDAWQIIKAHTFFSTGILIISQIGMLHLPGLRIHWAVVVTHFFMSVFALVLVRVMVKYVYASLQRSRGERKRVVIYGAGQMGVLTAEVVRADHLMGLQLVGFIDDNSSFRGKRMGDLPVWSSSEAFGGILQKQKVAELILAISSDRISRERKKWIVDQCLVAGIQVKEVPSPRKWINGKFKVSQLHQLNIEDLLGRDPIRLDKREISDGAWGRRIMVTGAAGSIGSEIVRQLVILDIAELIMVDIAESPMYDLHQEIQYNAGHTTVHQVIADVSDAQRMRRIFEKYRPELVYHASAYKHVPMMEMHPYEAVKTNVRGTKTVADLAREFKVERFVMVSTDKAVNPTNVMGAAKRICEIYIQSLSEIPGISTQFITTRFGNVLGSNGSVIPLFRKQIERGGPVTITHKDIIRYFMTIPEASQLVIEAGFMGKGGEIFLFEMGQPVKIMELAEKMISLAGFVPHEEIPIVETGLRPGEKLYEELLADKENALPTYHDKILIARKREFDYKNARRLISQLVENLPLLNDMEIVSMMKEIVTEFKSRNSVYEALDHPKPEGLNGTASEMEGLKNSVPSEIRISK